MTPPVRLYAARKDKRTVRFVKLMALPLVCAALGAAAPGEQHWTGDRVSRLAGLAALQSLELALLTQDSATLVLEQWCNAHRLGPANARIVADRDPQAARPPTAEQRRLLGVQEREPVRYRRVRLRCGTHVLSDAENWYVPGRLTPAMNAALDASDTPFGKVVQPLHFRRQTLSAKLLWTPVPSGWDQGVAIDDSAKPIEVPAHVIENQGLLVTPDGVPFSLVVERYTGDVLAFAPPSAQ
jgi:chorismate-pyruvate lyase